MTRMGLAALAVIVGLYLFAGGGSAPAFSQVMEHMDKAEPGQHAGHAENHHLHLTLGEAKCAPQFTYTQGPVDPASWGALCKLGKMQAPIDISGPEKLPLDSLKVAYQPSVLDVINDCNQYRVLLKFPDNYC